ncbi:VOC family protein [Panacibacter ginsenosidivorans]|uniref:VOC family protein n=1 Tax=Panacibacter ginsenosidivorans TaxID=1813871 RepID=A0A5B8VEX2_9BACT|nr:VOC family protein [Panacibacter ginsenosidivorans]QEC70044.1 VOC family protein [Panacibacter ginsenosidivorans]
MASLNPYLTFSGNCREAMNFYKECLGGELELMPVGETPVASQMPPHMKDAILHSVLKVGDFEIMATDMTPEALVQGNDMHLCLICKSDVEINSLFAKLSAGGKVKQPLSPMFFGLIGTLVDKFGKSWILELNKPAA